MAYSQRFERALALAHELHGSQVRKGSKVPFVTHLMAVSALVGEYGGSEDAVIGALLHDAAEDQGGRRTLARIESEFGPEVSRLVALCSDAYSAIKPPWKRRKEAFVQRLPDAPPEAKLIIAADKIHNARSIRREMRIHGAEAIFARFRGGREGTLWYLDACLAALRTSWDHPILEELRESVEGLKRDAEKNPS
jgi:(p)ppGpp synthase/HD superfamily hydrolase